MTLRIASVLTLVLLGGIVAWSATGTTQSYTLTDLAGNWLRRQRLGRRRRLHS